MTNPLQVNQENADTCGVQAPGSPKNSLNVPDIINTHVSPDYQQRFSQGSSQLFKQLMEEFAIDMQTKHFTDITQFRQDLDSTRDQLRLSEEKNFSFEAENLRLKTELECVQANEKSLHGELKKKCDELDYVKSHILEFLGH